MLHPWTNFSIPTGENSRSSCGSVRVRISCSGAGRTVDPDELEAVAAALARDPVLRALSPIEATVEWLRPIGSDNARH